MDSLYKGLACSYQPQIFKMLVKFIAVVMLYLFALLYINLNLDISYFYFFFLVIGVILKPKYLLSPVTMILVYYLLWFSVAPAFALRYKDISFSDPAVSLSYIYIITSFTVLISFSYFSEAYFLRRRNEFYSDSVVVKVDVSNVVLISLLSIWIISLIFYIMQTGGVEHWISNIDRAFLTRQGAGGTYLIFILTLPIFIFLCGVKFRHDWRVLLIVSALVLILSPFIGSKQKIISFFLLIYLPSFFNKKLELPLAIKIFLPVLLLFLLGNYFRNSSWMTWGDVLSYSLNYFDTLDSLLIIINNGHQPLEITPLFLPFNKFYNFYTGQDKFFDMSAYYTDIYFPKAWEIRATVQFPIEVDLLISFGFWLGLIPLALYAILNAFIFSMSVKSSKVILQYIWFFLFIYMLSHLRGGLLLWTDFYNYVYIVCIYIIFRGIERRDTIC